MKKIFLNPITILICVLLAVGSWVYMTIDNGVPDEFSEENWPKTEEKVKQVTIDYLKKEQGVDLVIERVSFSGEYATHEAYVDGHIANNERQKFSATVDTEKFNVKFASIENSP